MRVCVCAPITLYFLDFSHPEMGKSKFSSKAGVTRTSSRSATKTQLDNDANVRLLQNKQFQKKIRTSSSQSPSPSYSGLLGGFVGSQNQKYFLSSTKFVRCNSVPPFTLHGYRPSWSTSDASTKPVLPRGRHEFITMLPLQPVVLSSPGSLSMLSLPTFKKPENLYDVYQPPPVPKPKSCPADDCTAVVSTFMMEPEIMLNPVPRAQLHGNRSVMDELFALMAAPDVTRGRLSCVFITGPSGVGKTLGVISAAHAAKRHLIVVTATDLPLPGTRNSALFRALDAALLPARGGAVLLRFAEALEGDYASAVAAYLICRVLPAVQGFRLLFVTAPNANNDLLRAVFAIRSLTDSGAIRRLYFHAPTPEEAMLMVRQRSVERISDEEKAHARRLVHECGSDLRRLSRWLDGCDLDFSGFLAVQGADFLANMDANPFVLVPRILGGVRGQITPAFTSAQKKSAEGRVQRCSIVSILADVMASHDTSDTLDVLQENWTHVLYPQVVFREDRKQIPARWNAGNDDDLVFMADNLSDADLLSVWREGTDNEDVSEERYFSAMVAVQACSCLSWSYFKTGATRSKRPQFLAAQLDNLELVAQQRIEARLDMPLHALRLINSLAQKRIKDMSVFLRPTQHVTNVAVSERIAREHACNRVKSMRALTAAQALDWPVCPRD